MVTDRFKRMTEPQIIQCPAAAERILTDHAQLFAEFRNLKRAAILECAVPDLTDLLRQTNRRDAVLSRKCAVIDDLHAVRNLRRAVLAAVGNEHLAEHAEIALAGGQPLSFCKRIRSELRNRIRHLNFRERGASCKCALLNLRDA